MITAVCPKDPEHKRFVTSAAVSENWVVDEHGDFQEVFDTTDTISGPDPDNVWCCLECGEEAAVIAA